jgi:hypothetical protein
MTDSSISRAMYSEFAPYSTCDSMSRLPPQVVGVDILSGCKGQAPPFSLSFASAISMGK